MKNLHLKNLKDNNIEQIKQTSWFKQFNKEQQYYIEKGLKHNIDVKKFANIELKPTEMFNKLRVLEKQKYGKVLTSAIFHIEPPREIQIQKIIDEL